MITAILLALKNIFYCHQWV